MVNIPANLLLLNWDVLLVPVNKIYVKMYWCRMLIVLVIQPGIQSQNDISGNRIKKKGRERDYLVVEGVARYLDLKKQMGNIPIIIELN